ncbi:MAG: outer membrane protein transport protein [Bacteroidales bacterium]
MNIKKITLFIMANLVGLALMAEGYQLNTQSARQLGMGHLGVALKLGSESMLFNPAGLSFMNGKADISLGATGIMSKITYTNKDYKVESDNPIGTPIFGYAGFRLSEKFFAGVSITNPAGNSLFYPENWRGSHLVQDISLQAFSIQPTLSYKFSEKLSIGAGLMVDVGSFEINRGLMPVGALGAYLAAPGFPQAYKDIITSTIGISPINAKLEGKTKITYGVNIGVLFAPNNQWSFGVSYRSKVMMEIEDGDATVTYGTPELETLVTALSNPGTTDAPNPLFNPSIAGATALNGQVLKSKLPIPSNLTFGAAFKPNSNLLLSAELQYVGWKAYDTLKMEFPNLNLTTAQSKNFSNAMIYRVGGEYYASEKTTLRAGFIYDSTPGDKNWYSPETPGANKISVTAGLTFAPTQKFAIDLGLQYLSGTTKNASMPQASPMPAFVGDYKSTAILPSLGVRFNF